ncbi:alpha/beta hydrolase [Sphingoaurantiacus capsulatus]|uniref:Alpha/beta hydrolase n=1 Tax=Sphingoaurantiacus capsulatus TaxID=1771310 RepID=A0ABV7X8B7_9SPHN
MTRRMARRGFIAALAAGLASACSPLGTLNGLNNLSPGDRGVRKAAGDVPFGDDPRQRLDIYAPVKSDTPLPVIVFFYGGSWASGSRGGYGFAAKAFAARGFTVVVPDYRLVPQVHFPGFVEDGAAAVAWTMANIGRYGGDPAKVSLVGHSAGAYIAMMLALDPQWLHAAGSDPARLRAVAGLAGPYDFVPFDVAATRNAFGKAADPATTQPISFARGDAPPLFLATGTEDTMVLPRNSRKLAKAVEAAGGKAILREYPELGHVGIVVTLSKPFRGRAPVLRDVVEFLKAH